jgi:DNA polymerase III epsilon subunit-like protein
VDIEADGPIPGDYSMISVGAVLIDEALDTTFYAHLRPISDQWVPNALAVSGFSREETLEFDDPKAVMERFRDWARSIEDGPCMFLADNTGFDWGFVNWYFHHFLGENPFGYNTDDIGSLYKGMVGDIREDFEHLRGSEHTHNALDDAIGNAQALNHMVKELGLKLPR